KTRGKESAMENVEQRVKKIVAEQLGVNEAEIKNASSLVDDLGAVSLDTVELVMALEEEFETEIPDEEAEKITTVQQAIDYVNAHAIRISVNIGYGIDGLAIIEGTHNDVLKGGPRKISPFFIPSTIINMISGNLSIMHGLKGPNLAMVTACTTSAHCIGESGRLIEYGDCDVMVAGGAEATITLLAVGGFAAARALSTRNDDPATASRPWDRDRDGFVLGEGAG